MAVFKDIFTLCILKGLKGDDMKIKEYQLGQINSEVISIVDVYLKSVINHTVIRYEIKNNRFKRKGISYICIDDDKNTLYRKESFCHNSYYIIETEMGDIKVTNESFADLLLQLPELHKEVLIQNVIFDVKLEDFAKKYGIGKRTAERYKKLAKEFIKKGMMDSE